MSIVARCVRISSTPTAARIYMILMAVGGSRVALSTELSEADVVRLAQSRDPNIVSAEAAVQVVDAASVGASVYPNPTIEWAREQFGGDTPEYEDAWVVTLPIDLSTRRSTRAGIISTGRSLASARAHRTRSAAVERALLVFFAAVAENDRIRIEQHALDRLKDARRIVTRRREEGTVSGYDLARIEIEAELLTSALQQTRSRADQSRAELGVLLGLGTSTVTVVGDLTTELPASESAAEERPSIQALREAERAAVDTNDNAGWTWVPTVALRGGLRHGAAQTSRYGYVAGLSIAVPVFSRGQGLRAEAAANQRLAEARANAAARDASIETQRAAQRLSAFVSERQRFEASVATNVETMERAAESGYREGQRTLVELLDARRVRTAVETRRLALGLAAKKAEIALRAARGEFE